MVVVVQERLLASMLTHQLVADMKRDSVCKRLPLAVCASRNGAPLIYDCVRFGVFSSRPLHAAEYKILDNRYIQLGV